MSYKEIKTIEKRINSLIDRIKKLSKKIDIEINADLSKYLCILLSGYFEKSICDIINTYGDNFSPQISKCLQWQFKRKTNINMDNLLKIIEQFDLSWKEKFQNNPSFDVWEQSLDSIVNNRNNIAHAGNSNITLDQLEEHYKMIKEMLDTIRTYFRIY